MEGDLVAVGRDSQLFDAGPGLLVKRARAERTLEYEANAMELVRAFGIPVPKVHDVRANGTEIVMQRVEGPTMLQWIERGPWRVDAAGRVLGELADAVHGVLAPTWMRDAGDGGDRVLHLDLHPLNVIMAADGPVLIDWANTARGAPSTDDALTWILLATGELDDMNAIRRAVVVLFRNLFVSRYLAHRDRTATRAALAHAAALRLCVPNIRPGETAAIERLLETTRGA
jgi:aminoglycoside phosphotransferase (APT) family kinase protein